MKCARLITVVTLGMLCGMSRASVADEIYTFEAPQFILNLTTPLVNKAPNSGDPGFTTSFTSATSNGFTITNGQNSGVITGQSLIAPSTTDALQMTFNMPVTQISVDFAINDANGSPAG